jgi:hypothetical protein
MSSNNIRTDHKEDIPDSKAVDWNSSFCDKEQKRDISGIGRFLYGSGLVLSVCIMVLFGIRFFGMTGLERDLKIFIIMTLVSIFFLYSMLRSLKQSVKELPDQMDEASKPAAYTQQQEYPVVSMKEASVDSMTIHEEETQILKTETTCSEKDTQMDMRMDVSDASVLDFWELESQNTSAANIQLNLLPGVLGRKSEEVDYVISGEGISRRHAMLYISGDQLYVEDLTSTNGTYVDHVRLKPEEPVVLKENSLLGIGPNQYQVKKKTIQKAG